MRLVVWGPRRGAGDVEEFLELGVARAVVDEGRSRCAAAERLGWVAQWSLELGQAAEQTAQAPPREASKPLGRAEASRLQMRRVPRRVERARFEAQ